MTSAQRFGDRSRFAVEIGDHISSQLREVELWAGGTLVNPRDNWAFVPSFCLAIRNTADVILRGEIEPSPFPGRLPETIYHRLRRDRTGFRQRFWFMKWDEITDEVSEYAYLDGDRLVLTFEFSSPSGYPIRPRKVFVARIPATEMATILLDTADHLELPA